MAGLFGALRKKRRRRDTWEGSESYYVGMPVYRPAYEKIARLLDTDSIRVSIRFDSVHAHVEFYSGNQILVAINMYGSEGSVFRTVVRTNLPPDETLRKLCIVELPATVEFERLHT